MLNHCTRATNAPAEAVSQQGSASTVPSLIDHTAQRFFEPSSEARLDHVAAEAAFASDGPVIDVPTQWHADRPSPKTFESNLMNICKVMDPDCWEGVKGIAAYNIAHDPRCIFISQRSRA